MQLPYSGYRFLRSGYRFPKKRFSSCSAAVLILIFETPLPLTAAGGAAYRCITAASPLHHRCRAAHLHKSADFHCFLEAVGKLYCSGHRFLGSSRAVELIQAAEKMAPDTFILNPIFITNVVKKLLVELKYKTKDNLMPNCIPRTKYVRGILWFSRRYAASAASASADTSSFSR